MYGACFCVLDAARQGIPVLHVSLEAVQSMLGLFGGGEREEASSVDCYRDESSDLSLASPNKGGLCESTLSPHRGRW